MKKLMCLLLAFAAAISFTACSNDSSEAYGLYSGAAEKAASLSSTNSTVKLSVIMNASGKESDFSSRATVKTATKDGNKVCSVNNEVSSAEGKKSVSYYSENGVTYVEAGTSKYSEKKSVEQLAGKYVFFDEPKFNEECFKEVEFSQNDKNSTAKFSVAAGASANALIGNLSFLEPQIGKLSADKVTMSNLNVELTFDTSGYLTLYKLSYNFTATDTKTVVAVDYSRTLEYPGIEVLVKQPSNLTDYIPVEGNGSTASTTASTDVNGQTTATTATSSVNDAKNQEIINSIDDMELGNIDKQALKNQIAADLAAAGGQTSTTTAAVPSR